jgi:3-dehydroquinate dehydratase-1
MIHKSAIVAVLGEDARKHLSATEEADMIELRLDLIHKSDPLGTLKALREATSKPIIATVRLRDEGGMFQGSEVERIDLLVKASSYADYADVELLAEMRDEAMSRIKKPVIVSYHDFQNMLDDRKLAEVYGQMKNTKAAIAKIALTPQNLEDNLRILEFLLDADTPLCMIAMGRIGRHLRAVAPLYGSALTYGFVTESTAPGQMSLKELIAARRLLDDS